MVLSRGGISGGMTIADALREFEHRGYVGQFVVRPGGLVECCHCGRRLAPRHVPLEAMRRVEGASDPADELLVGALACPQCGQRGTAVIKYGPMAEPEDAIVLRELDNHRLSTLLSRESEADEGSAVRDTGWIDHADQR